jgi:hypothetical protein
MRDLKKKGVGYATGLKKEPSRKLDTQKRNKQNQPMLGVIFISAHSQGESRLTRRIDRRGRQLRNHPSSR